MTKLDHMPLTAPVDALTRNRRLATGVLVLLAAIFFASYLAGQPPGWVLLIRAMAEAGMVGGLADWFAVTALFRHPLGLPIPHTALLPRNQARAARNVGRFFETHFLEPQQLHDRLLALRPSGLLVEWIASRDHARLIAAELATILPALLKAHPPKRALVHGRRWLRREAMHFGADEAIAARMAELVKAGIRGGILDNALQLLEQTVEQRRDGAVGLVSERSRWWIASTVDREVAGLVVRGILSILRELQEPGSPLRSSFEDAFDGMVDGLTRQGALTVAVAEARQHMIRTGAFDQALTILGQQIQSRIRASLSADPDATAEILADLVQGVAARLLSSRQARAGFDARFAQLGSRVIGELRPRISAYVSDVIAGWEPEELNARFEGEIGPDLQFIRINGALLGAVIGGALFAFDTLLG
ncbi:DUF445 domain-containing protein [Paracoccus sp. (in: a-proteobacteria)]|uniref:DUF445 domain-containing protein n=1 Tax=Paracoccus sp. TaxID=267 RepID=UPI003A88E5A9